MVTTMEGKNTMLKKLRATKKQIICLMTLPEKAQRASDISGQLGSTVKTVD